MKLWLVSAFLLVCFCSAMCHGQVLGPAPIIATLHDDASATDFALFTIAAEGAQSAASFTVQCSQTRNRRRKDLFFNPSGGVVSTVRMPDLEAAKFPNPDVKIALDLDGEKTFKLVWERLPSGEYHYRNPGGSSNLIEPLLIMQWMYSTRITRVRVPGLDAVPEFHVPNMITEAYKSPLCGR